MTGVASVRVRRFESKPRAAGCRPGTPSITPWLSPPTVQTVGERASASNNRLVPERGAPTTNIGRSKRWAVSERRWTLSAPTRGALATAGGAADGAASSGLRAGRISSCRTLSTASTSLRSQTLPASGSSSASSPRRSRSKAGQPSRPAAYRAQTARHSVTALARQFRSARSAAASLRPRSTPSTIDSASRACSDGCITTGKLARSVSRRGRSPARWTTVVVAALPCCLPNGRSPRSTSSQKAAEPTVSRTR